MIDIITKQNNQQINKNFDYYGTVFINTVDHQNMNCFHNTWAKLYIHRLPVISSQSDFSFCQSDYVTDGIPKTKKPIGNAFASEVGGLRFKSRAGQIGCSVANNSPLL